jgi:CDP-diacylglycerol--glycerol-3-phosphate 3-phosphatidyltransferase
MVRILLSPVFFLCWFLPAWTGAPEMPVMAALLVIFMVMELTDLADGHLARRLGQVSELGKVLDPFADSVSRLTYFLCFTASGIMPLWVFLAVLYRDLGVSFIRQMAAGRGTMMAARASGKIKALVYALAGLGGVIFHVAANLRGADALPPEAHGALFVLFLATGVTAAWSLLDYALALRSMNRRP